MLVATDFGQKTTENATETTGKNYGIETFKVDQYGVYTSVV